MFAVNKKERKKEIIEEEEEEILFIFFSQHTFYVSTITAGKYVYNNI
jgi:hypothetical protein